MEHLLEDLSLYWRYYLLIILFSVIAIYIGIDAFKKLYPKTFGDTLMFGLYADILKHPDKFRFNSHMGVENALMIFNQEAETLCGIIDTYFSRLESFKSGEGTKFEEYESRVATLIYALGYNMTHLCDSYCRNKYHTPMINIYSGQIVTFIKNAQRIYNQYNKMKLASFENHESIIKLSEMYHMYFRLFDSINSAIFFKQNKVYIPKEESVKHD